MKLGIDSKPKSIKDRLAFAQGNFGLIQDPEKSPSRKKVGQSPSERPHLPCPGRTRARDSQKKSVAEREDRLDQVRPPRPYLPPLRKCPLRAWLRVAPARFRVPSSAIRGPLWPRRTPFAAAPTAPPRSLLSPCLHPSSLSHFAKSKSRRKACTSASLSSSLAARSSARARWLRFGFRMISSARSGLVGQPSAVLLSR